MANSVLTTKLDFWIKHNKNVLFIGKHGVGKTAVIKEAFDRHKLNWRYFSASTMDPWVDFVGVPKEKTEDKVPEQFEIIRELDTIDPQLAQEFVQSNWRMSESSAARVVSHTRSRRNGLTYLDLVRPQTFASGDIEALFFDEYNRSPKKVRNAVMELIQFGSINGLKFPKLRFVWAAINPDDDETETYDVERLDPAQQDRFHITVLVPYKPNAEWFRQEYGNRIADAAIQWWDDLNEDEKGRVSPRRLQYALDVYRQRGDMRDVLPATSNISKLTTALNNGPVTEKLEALMKSKDPADARSFMANENNYAQAMKYISKSGTLMEYFLPLIPKEKLSTLMSDDDKMANYVSMNSDKVPVFMAVCKDVLKANANARLVRKIRRVLTENQELAAKFNEDDGSDGTPTPAHYAPTALAGPPWAGVLAELRAAPLATPQQRTHVWGRIESSVPQHQSAAEALQCLEVIDSLVTQNKGQQGQFAVPEKLVGVVNNCIGEIHRNTGLDWSGILAKHGSHFKALLEHLMSTNQTRFLRKP